MSDLYKKAWFADEVPPEAWPLVLASSMRACGEVPGALAAALDIRRQRLLDFARTGELFADDACDRGGLRYSEARQIFEYLAERHHLFVKAYERGVEICFYQRMVTA
ncbi:hypothetical protein PQU94_11060 [Asticcacaulis sp. DXS10W]|uniref:Uncharacterized protein n=1 Tax=Asticcacaulis currens TaxID=2984210 RepID=A0ABT5IF65_9CAUL|nr:hypothetical protein [Asticcacaulis currens]MDC7694819.1 hypothetical protein [Asticcacaulis currens]